MSQSKKQMAGDKSKIQISWDQWAALPEYVRERALLDDMRLIGQDVKEYPFLNKGRDIRLTLQQQDLFRRTVGFPFSLSVLKVYLAQKCNIQNPENYSIWDIIAALESSLQKTVATQAGTGGKEKAAQKAAEAEKPGPETQPKLPPRSMALILRKEHRDWTNTRIAKEVGVERTSLYRWPEYKKLCKLMREQWSLPRGSKDKDGSIEAIAED